MALDAGVREEMGRLLGSHITAASALSGGDINEAWRVDLADGRRVFLKTNGQAPPAMFPAEAEGLAWLAEAGALAVPTVLAVSPRALALAYLAPGPAGPGFDERLGHGLAALHRAGAERFGFRADNYIGRLPQDNAPASSTGWAAFYRERRLEPQVRRAVDGGLVSPRLGQRMAALLDLLDQRVGPPEPPARLHGDLWGGNLMCGPDGAPWLIDPAVYGGHREVDLAMMRLFGGFGARVFAAYQETFPLPDGHAERVPLYQLYPLLVHLNLFGVGYLGALEGALGRLGA